MTLKVPAASSLFDEIEVPRDAIRLTVWNVDVFVARMSHVAELAKFDAAGTPATRLLFAPSHDETNVSRATAERGDAYRNSFNLMIVTPREVASGPREALRAW